MAIWFKPAEKAPCMLACPAGIDVPRYIRHISQGEFDQSLAVIRESIPFPSVCGYVCTHACETQCRSNMISSPIAIRALKRFVAEGRRPTRGNQAKSTGKKVAVVGAGPAGLTTAYHLARLGHSVTVLEASAHPGGMMYWGIPEYRLPKAVLKAEVGAIKDTGVDIKTNSPIKSLSELKGYDAIFVATGSQQGIKLGVKEEDISQVRDALSLLKEVNAGRKINLSGTICVVGGGNVAIDVARTALRLGADKVKLIYRRSRAEMRASPEEIDGATDEEVEILYQAVPSHIARRNGKVTLTCLRTKLGEQDESGRRKPITVKGSDFSLDCDEVIYAIGQIPEILNGFGATALKGGFLKVNEDTMATINEGVFAGGDVVTGPASIIEAIAAGKKAASAIDKYLGGSGNVSEKLAPPEGEVKAFVPDLTLLRVAVQSLPAGERIKNFALVEQPLTEEMAITEAKRCLRCDLPIYVDTEKCVGCRTCELICSLIRVGYFSWKDSKIHGVRVRGGADYTFTFDEDCDTCGLCVRYCTHNVLTREKKGDG